MIGANASEVMKHLGARLPVIGVVTPEEERFVKDLTSEWIDHTSEVSSEVPGQVRTWSLTRGIDETEEQPTPPAGLGNIFDRILNDHQSPNTVWVLKDVAPFLADAGVARTLRDMHKRVPRRPREGDPVGVEYDPESERGGLVGRRVHVILLCTQRPGDNVISAVPEIPFIDLPRPSIGFLEGQAKQARQHFDGDNPEDLARVGAGLTSRQFRNALALAKTTHGDITVNGVSKFKADMLASECEGLEIVDVNVTEDDVGGHGALKQAAKEMALAFSPEATAFGLQQPKGYLFIGPPGVGKSLVAKVLASIFNMSLFRQDCGALQGSLVGESEQRMRKMLSVVEANAPCILQFDEMEKAFSSANVSSGGDSGASSRQLQTFLTWMAEKTAPVFVVATVNDVTKLPLELTRKGRFDEMWFLDLPDASSRKQITEIHLRRSNRDPSKFKSLKKVGLATDGFSGAEIEAVVQTALRRCFFDGNELSALGLLNEAKSTVPLSKGASEEVESMRSWSRGRARNSSNGSGQSKKTSKGGSSLDDLSAAFDIA